MLGNFLIKSQEGFLKWGVWLNAPFWIIRLLFISPFGLFVTNLLSAGTSSLVGIPVSKLVFSRAKKSKWLAHFFLFRESNLAIGRIVLLTAGIITQSLLWMFVTAFFLEFVHLAALKK